MNSKKLIKECMNSIRPMGLVPVKKLRSNHGYLTASANTAGTINSLRFQLMLETFFPSAGQAQDWKEQ